MAGSLSLVPGGLTRLLDHLVGGREGATSVSGSSIPIEPMTLSNMRENGVRSLAVQCHQCRHETIVNVDHWPGDMQIPLFGPRMVCTKCGTIGADLRPNWRERERP
jgi:hypothetical protein